MKGAKKKMKTQAELEQMYKEMKDKKICNNCIYFNGIKRARGFCIKHDHYTFTIEKCDDFECKACNNTGILIMQDGNHTHNMECDYCR